MYSVAIPFAALVAGAVASPQGAYGYGAPAYNMTTPVSSSTPVVTPTPYSTSSASGDCQSKYDACRVAPDANMAYCASQYASCLGYNPFTQNATTSTPSGYESSTTEVVTSFTTYCPEPTTLTYNSKTYTVTSATTLTITDCPCTLTKPAGPKPTGYSNGTATDVYVTAVVTSFTTVCPSATTLTVPCGSGPAKTYTVTQPTTLTITQCPGGCHVTTPAKSMPPASTITAIVSSYETYCPAPTTITYGPSTSSSTIIVSKPTTVTISSCPGGCTVTAPVSAITPPSYPTSPATGNGTTPASPTGPTPYTGAAGKVVAGGSFMAAAIAAVFFL